jgi:PEP-CTERM motif
MRLATLTLKVSVCFNLCLFTIATAGAASWDESVSGDLSNNPAAPTGLTLTLGANSVIGTVNGSGGDSQDWIALTVPAGFQMTSYVNAVYTSSDAQGFTGFQFGPTFPGSAFSAGSYAGYAHFGTGATNPSPPTSTVGVDLLPLMASPTVAPGSTGFTPPLAAGTYTFLIQQLGSSTNYEFDMNLSSVPEPATLCLLSLGALALLVPAASRFRRQVQE